VRRALVSIALPRATCPQDSRAHRLAIQVPCHLRESGTCRHFQRVVSRSTPAKTRGRQESQAHEGPVEEVARYACAMTDTATHAVEPLGGPTGRLVTAHRSELREVLHRHGVTNARLFGSVVRGDDHEGSDVDLLVRFAPGTGLFAIAGIQRELEEILGVEVDLVPDSGLKDKVRQRVERDLIAL